MPSSSTARAVGPLVRRRGHLPLLICTAVAVALLGSGCDTAGSSAATAKSSVAATQSENQQKASSDQAITPPGTSLIATASSSRVAIHKAPEGEVRKTMSNPTAIGAPLTFMILERRPGWLKVQLPMRPNGSAGWVAETDVEVSATPYRLIISMSQHRLDVMYKGKRIARHEIGVGTVATPTPKGTYYLTELIEPPNPKGAYGPYAFGLSAYSNTLKSFAGGPGQLGLHGTDAPKGLGSDISHGCIRVANTVITELASKIPLGTPIDIRR